MKNQSYYKTGLALVLSLSAATSGAMVGDAPLPKPWWGEPHLPFPVEVYDPTPRLIHVNDEARIACMAACNAMWVAGPAAAPAVAACMASCPAAIRN